MAQVFTPHFTIHVIASDPHPPKTEYRVGRGYETWQTKASISKVQMVYENKVAGKVVPSFPENTLDLRSVMYAFDILSKGWGVYSKTKRSVVILKKKTSGTSLDELSTLAEDEVSDFYLNLIEDSPLSGPISTMEKKREELEDGLVAFVFDVNLV
ncbi:hypothetical protein [Paenibacillus polymyxa]|uniref:hypothetical protein n=1 Tax=Paenibacillus polymyxa TaxID=1406 RepID=UPI001ABB4ED4|nr:hypothetical protein [Paenibacillus polymyxa]MBO3284740.1 hypothetical protein [Paenibacillus polymyxa]